MKFQYLGTAAAEGWPGIFCQCEFCKKAIKAGGRNIRTRSQAIVDDKLLIDFPPDTYMHVLYGGLDLASVKHCLLTHNHSDHLYPEDIGMRRTGFAHFTEEACLTFYGTEGVGVPVKKEMEDARLERDNRVAFQVITPFHPFTVEEYTVIPLRADHSASSDPVIYVIQKEDKTLLYANDTGYFPDVSWEYLEKNEIKFDFVSLDCTCGLLDCSRGHMGFSTCIEVKERLICTGCTKENTRFCLHHFSHNGKAIYDELVPLAEKEGFLVSYDGMIVRIE
ncbi:MAG: MBL fold metallo-hydrolase [Clostridia bacterium]|nr:hypothetical protein [Clostridiaceae bacterium]